MEAAKTLFRNRLKSLDAQLARGDYLAGDFTAADISVGYSLGMGEMMGLAEAYSPQLQAYFARLMSRPAYQRAASK